LGKSLIYGVAYDRILISKKIEWHVNIGFTPPPISRYESFQQRSSQSLFIWNMSTYVKTSFFKVNPVLGIGAMHAITQSGEWSIYTTHTITPGILIGISFKLNDNWDMMINYTPSFLYSFRKSEDLEPPNNTDYSKDVRLWPYWGGISFAHRF
jgi:hypothetical protein